MSRQEYQRRAASIARWRETADKAFQFDALDALRGGGNV